MESLLSLLSVNTIFFTVFGYPMSYIEFFGTLANLWSVWLVGKKNSLTWPVGIVGVILFLWLFYQINLYSDLIEQGYFLVTSFWGWWAWHTAKTHSEGGKTIQVEISSIKEQIIFLFITVLGTLGLWQLTLNLPSLLPRIFPEPPSYAFFDALTTVMSFVATYLMIKRKLTCWYYWIIVDVIGIVLYFLKDVRLISLLYVLFLILAIKGLYIWRQSVQRSEDPNEA